MMFSRIAHNLVKAGYFPTDEDTLSRVALMLGLAPAGKHYRIADPCCGEGHALSCLTSYLQQLPFSEGDAGNRKVHAYGVEYDKERYGHALNHAALTQVACADIQNVHFSAQQYGFVYLNPPYGDLLTDKAGTGDKADSDGKAKRMELYFLERMMPTLQSDGVLVYVIPLHCISKPVASLIARNFVDVSVHLAPDTTYKQCVIAGVKRPANRIANEVMASTYAALMEAVEMPPSTLPVVWVLPKYTIPEQSQGEHLLTVKTIDPELLGERVSTKPVGTLWPRFELTFKSGVKQARRPLCKLSPWHMALSLAAGQVSGLVTAPDGGCMLVKGNTIKVKDTKVVTEVADDGKSSVTKQVKTDKFKAVIRGITFAPKARLGQIIEIG
jgi:tRNA1(Val) A37 N6-methylase TrmN6